MIYNLVLSLIYVALMLWIYGVEFTHFWTYMRFEGELDLIVAFIALSLSALLSLLLPVNKTARGYILIVVHYFFFLPSIVYFSFNRTHLDYALSLAIAVLCIYLGSAIQIPRVAMPTIRRSILLTILFSLVAMALLLQIAYGGLSTFNLNMEEVYNFRSEAAAAMPAVIGYIFSNVANVLIPSSIALSLYLRSRLLAIVGFLASIVLFGMSHHKSIVFVSLMVLGMYFVLQRIKRLPTLAFLPLALVAICAIEVFYHLYISSHRDLSLITSYIVRRTLLVPPMLDASSVELFSEQAKYYWSTSKFGLGIASNPYDVTAPFLMGITFFDDPSMSANPGNIGSGYSHAGLVGVFIYSMITGLFIAFVNSIGGKVGHALTASISVPIILIVQTSADLTTAILSHGMFMLFLVLLFIPRSQPLQNDPSGGMT